MTHYESIEKLQKKLKDVRIPRKDFIAEHNKLIPLLKSGTQAQRVKEANDQSRELKKVLKGDGFFPNIILNDSKLDDDKIDTLYNAGDDESITLKKIPDPFRNENSPIRWIKIYPTGAHHESLHLESSYNDSNKELHIWSINTELEKSKGTGTYLFSLLFNYLTYNSLNFRTISLIFAPSIPNPDEKSVKKRITNPAVMMRGMKFYFKIFSHLANFYPMIGRKQITDPTEENLQAVIDDYEKITGNEGMIFKSKTSGGGLGKKQPNNKL